MHSTIIFDFYFRRRALVLLILCSIGTVLPVRAQQPEVKTDTQRGIALYEHNRAQDAIEVLKRATKANSSDADAWHFLGLSYYKVDQIKDARKALERAIKLRPNFAPSHTSLGYVLLLSGKLKEADREANTTLSLDPNNVTARYIKAAVRLRQDKPTLALPEIETALRLDPTFSAAYLIKCQSLVALFDEDAAQNFQDAPVPRYHYLNEAADALEEFFKLNPNESRSGYWAEQLATLRLYGGYRDQVNPATQFEVYTPSKVTVKAKILSKPSPEYTEEARNNGYEGTVRLRAVLTHDGRVRNILVLHSIGQGLTENAVNAAKQIRFLPASINGRPVSQFVTIEYHFNVF